MPAHHLPRGEERDSYNPPHHRRATLSRHKRTIKALKNRCYCTATRVRQVAVSRRLKSCRETVGALLSTALQQSAAGTIWPSAVAHSILVIACQLPERGSRTPNSVTISSNIKPRTPIKRARKAEIQGVGTTSRSPKTGPRNPGFHRCRSESSQGVACSSCARRFFVSAVLRHDDGLISNGVDGAQLRAIRFTYTSARRRIPRARLISR